RRCQNLQHILNRLLFEIGAAHQFFFIQGKHAPGRIASDTLELVDYPIFDLICKFIEIYVFYFKLIHIAVHVDFITRQTARQLDIATALTNGQRHLVRLQKHRRPFVLLVDIDAGDLRRRQGPLYVQHHVVRKVDNVDILVAQLPHNPVDPRSFHTHAGAHRVDAVVVRLHRHLGALTRNPHNLAYRDQAVLDLRHLLLKQFFEKQFVRPRQDHHRVGVAHFHALDHPAHHVSFPEKIPPYHLRPGQHQLIARGVVDDQHLPLEHLVHLAQYDIADARRVALEHPVLFQLHDPRYQRLARSHNRTAAKIFQEKLLVALLPHFVVRLDRLRLRYRDLLAVIRHLTVRHDLSHTPHFQVTLLRVYDDVKILVRPKLLADQRPE